MNAAELQHAVIEQAKASYAAPSCDMPFDECLAFHAESMVQPPYRWLVGERNNVWVLDVWVGNAQDLGDTV